MQKLNEIYINRIYPVNVTQFWNAWVNTDEVSQWWGPRGFSIKTKSKELKSGGKWIYTMFGEDGSQYENVTLYHSVQPYKELIYDHGGNENQPPLFQVKISLTEVDNHTHMAMTMICESEQAAQNIKNIIKQAYGNSTWDRLAEYLIKKYQNKDVFIINHLFECEKQKLFNIWTDSNHIKKWLSPTGTKMKYIDCNIKPDGSAFYTMYNKDFKLFGKAFYKEIKPSEKLIYSQIFCDETGKVSRHPMAPVWPETMLTTVDFIAESKEQTRITIMWEAINSPTQAEIDFFISARAGMTQGWTGSFNKLEEYLLTVE